MKFLVTFLLISTLSYSQTIHLKDKQIVYEGKVKTPGLTQSQITSNTQKAITAIDKDARLKTTDSFMLAEGRIELNAARKVKRTLNYTLQIKPANDGYSYRIDSISIEERARGEKTKILHEKEILAGLKETGIIYLETEKSAQ